MIGYIISGIFRGTESISLLDPAMGTGNLLTALNNQLSNTLSLTPTVSGIENDDAMFELAADSFELQHIHAELFHEDAVQNVLAPMVDVAVSDLPIGYYPIDKNAKGFATHSENGHSYVHHLLIEFAMNHVKKKVASGSFWFPVNFFRRMKPSSC